LVVATVAVAMVVAMAIMAAATREVALPGWGDAITVCNAV